MALSDEKVREYHSRLVGNAVYQQVLGIVQEALPTGGTGVIPQPSPTHSRIAVMFFLLLENSITWDTSCLNCSRLLDSSIEQYERAENLADRLKAISRLAVVEGQ